MIKKHCKGCKFLLNTDPRFTSGWCIKVEQKADKSIGHCKLNNLKEAR